MPSFCSQCGTATTRGVRFCQQCGAPLQAGAATPVGAPVTTRSPFAAPPQRSGISTILWVVLGVLFSLLLAFGSCAYYVVHKARQVVSQVSAGIPRVEKRLQDERQSVEAPSDICALVTTAELEEIYGTPFMPGDRRGQECAYTKAGRSQPSVTILVDHSLTRYDRELQRRKAYLQQQIGEARAFFTSPHPDTMYMSYRWSYVEVSAEGGRTRCEQVARAILKRL